MRAGTSEVDRAHAIYTKPTLALYDWWVLRVSNERFWECPTPKLVEHYRAHLGRNHLEVGVGTGFFPAAVMPGGEARLALVDINRSCLRRASKRLAAFHPEVFKANVLEPFELPGPRFESAGLNYVLHCLPGRIEEKAARVFDHLAAHLRDDGILFGSTILGKDVQRSRRARLLMALYNHRGIFANAEDSLGGLMEALSQRFRTFNVEVCGCVVLFWGRGLRETYRHTRSPELPGAAPLSSPGR